MLCLAFGREPTVEGVRADRLIIVEHTARRVDQSRRGTHNKTRNSTSRHTSSRKSSHTSSQASNQAATRAPAPRASRGSKHTQTHTYTYTHNVTERRSLAPRPRRSVGDNARCASHATEQHLLCEPRCPLDIVRLHSYRPTVVKSEDGPGITIVLHPAAAEPTDDAEQQWKQFSVPSSTVETAQHLEILFCHLR